MTWTVASASQRHRALTFDGPGTWRADPTTTAAVHAATGTAPPLVECGSPYQVDGQDAGPADEVWLYLTARYFIPGPLKVTGEPPRIPLVAPTPPGAVC
jgi:hypothetical protein